MNLEKSGEAPWRKHPKSSVRGQMKVSLTKGQRMASKVYQAEGTSHKKTHTAQHIWGPEETLI